MKCIVGSFEVQKSDKMAVNLKLMAKKSFLVDAR